ncbi:hypothetical protein B0H19DRAFT_1085363 [Mycena capillaripes]|nr:hypothetical protein B0H19DRAFT_1085363 [Mycena capillaripes]
MQNLPFLISLLTVMSLGSVARNTGSPLLGRDDSAEPVTLGINPSPTLTDVAVASAYSVYSQKCGPDLNSAAYAGLSLYVSEGGISTARITDGVVIDFMDQLFGTWTEAKDSCDDASNALDNAEFNATPSPTTTDNTPPPTRTEPQGTTSDDDSDDGPSVTFSGSAPPFTGFPSGFPGASLLPGLPSVGGTSETQTQSPPVPTPSKGGGSAVEPVPIFVIAVIFLAHAAA